MLTNPLFLSLLFGFAPPIIWLALWLQEDRLHPEPKPAIIKTFLLGAATVLIALIVEGILGLLLNSFGEPLQLFLWAIVEEGLKLGAVIISMRYLLSPIDEPIDWIIYMITAALGFAAAENVLFLIEPFGNSFIVEGLVVSNLRFIGATVLHLVASAAHGAALALCFYLSNRIKYRYYVIGFIIAVLVHYFFNLFIIIGGESTLSTLFVFAGVWLLLLPLILIFEKVKTIRVENI